MEHELLREKLNGLEEIKDEFDFTLSLLNITEELDGSQSPAIYRRTLDAASSIKDDYLRGQIFLIIFSRSDDYFKHQSLFPILYTVGNKKNRFKLLGEFILDRYYKIHELVHENKFVLQKLGNKRNEDTYFRLSEPVHSLRQDNLAEHLSVPNEIKDESLKLEVFAHLAEFFESEIEKPEFILRQGDIYFDPHVKNKELYLSHLRDEFIQQTLFVLSKKDEERCAEALLDIAHILDGNFQKEALDIIRKFDNLLLQARTLEDLYLSMHPSVHYHVIEAVDNIKKPDIHDRVLENLITRKIENPLLLLFALSKINNKDYQNFIINKIVGPRISREGFESQIQKKIYDIRDKPSQLEILVLVARLSTDKQAVISALELAHDIAFDIIQRREDLSRFERIRELVDLIETDLRKIKRDEPTTKNIEPIVSKYVPSSKPIKPIIEEEEEEENDDEDDEDEEEEAHIEKSLPVKPKSSPIEHKKTPSQKRTEEVFFTAYYPKEGKVNTWHPLLVYVHIASMLEEIQKDVKRFEDQIGLSKEISTQSSRNLKRGAELTIIPNCHGITFNPPQISFGWMEDFQRAEFRFVADKSLLDDAAKGEVIIYLGPVIVGVLKFAMLFSNKPSLSIREESLQMYGKNEIFISYSRKDKEIVKTFKKVYDTTGFDAFLDTENIRSGQDWERILKQKIEEAKIFQLFWSKNYSDSKNCEMEWRHALAQEREMGYIRALFWKEPLFPDPPTELKKYDFKYHEISISNILGLVRIKLWEFIVSISNIRLPRLRFSRFSIFMLLCIFTCLLMCLFMYILALPRINEITLR